MRTRLLDRLLHRPRRHDGCRVTDRPCEFRNGTCAQCGIGLLEQARDRMMIEDHRI
jgi:hypothetical protein